MTEKQQAIVYYDKLMVKLREYQIIGGSDVLSEGMPWGYRAEIVHIPTGNRYQSIWVYEKHRGAGFMSGYAKNTKMPFITQLQCGINEWFEDRGVSYLMVRDC